MRATPLRSSALASFFFNDTATTEIYTLSLHDALPISAQLDDLAKNSYLSERQQLEEVRLKKLKLRAKDQRSEEHTSELQSHLNLVCRLLLEKKKYRASKLTQRPSWTSRKITAG